MKRHTYRYVFTNLVVVGIHLFTNPFIALLLCAIISSLNLRINYYIFTTSFILSWTIFHFMRDFDTSGGDIIPYLEMFYISIDDSIYSILNNFIDDLRQNEPLWRLINKLLGFFIGYNPSIYIFIIYLLIFQLLSYLGFIINKQKAFFHSF